MNTTTIKEQVFRSFREKKQRHLFAAKYFFTNLATQIFALREAQPWTQQQLAEASGMAQPRIALLEDPNHENVGVKTLQRIAQAFDVVFVGRFVSFGEFADWIAHSPQLLVPPSFKRDPFHLTFLSPQRESIPEEQKDKVAVSTPAAGGVTLTGYAPTVLVTASLTAGIESTGKQPIGRSDLLLHEYEKHVPELGAPVS